VKEYIILHHSGATTENHQWKAINSWHRIRRFPRSKLGYWVGYHYVIEKDGYAGQYRWDEEKGAHCDTKDYNLKSIGICLAGDFTQQKPTTKQLKAMVRLVSRLQQRYGIDPKDVKLHRQLKPTACPGIDLKTYLDPFEVPTPSPSKKKWLRAIERAKNRFSGKVLQRLLNRLERRLLSIS